MNIEKRSPANFWTYFEAPVCPAILKTGKSNYQRLRPVLS